MSKLAVITVEGVLADGLDLRGVPPTKWANPLYDALHTQFRTVAFTRAAQDIAHWWLRREGLIGWSAVQCWNQIMGFEDWKVDRLREFLAEGWEIGVYLDCDRDVTTVAQSMGILTLTLGEPLVHPGWKSEDTVFRTWDEVKSTLDV